jgi:hypothetical protein
LISISPEISFKKVKIKTMVMILFKFGQIGLEQASSKAKLKTSIQKIIDRTDYDMLKAFCQNDVIDI